MTNEWSAMSDQADQKAALSLAGDFAVQSREDWEKEVLKVLNRRRPEGTELGIEQAYKRLTTTTVDGITIKPLYVSDDFTEELGYPGVAPFTRGTVVRSGDMDAWDVCVLHEDPDVAATRKAVLTDLERGATSVWVRLDEDAIAPADLAEACADVMLELAPVSVSSRSDQDAAADALLELFRASGKPRDHVGGNLGIDPIGFAALHGTTPDLGQLPVWYVKAADYPDVTPLVVDSTVYHNAGAGDVQELAYAIATGVEYVRALVDSGVRLEDAFGALIFRVTAGTDQFLTIARLRALRTLWSRVGEVLGVDPAHRGAIQHAVTSWREISRDDPYVNVLRATIACFAAAAGGAESQTVLPLDAAVGQPTESSRRIARNIQIVLAEESNVGRVNDPAGGSWYVESLTKQLEEAAWKIFTEIDTEGMAAAVASGKVGEQIAETRAARDEALAKRTVPLTGVSMFPMVNEKRLERKPLPEAPEFAGLAPIRDADVFEALRDRSAAASEKPKVLLAGLGARRDFGAREGFTSPVFAVAGIETVLAEGVTAENAAEELSRSGAKIAVLCSSAKVYAEHAQPVARALKDAGATKVFLAGSIKEAGEGADQVIDGTVFAGMNVVEFLSSTLDELGVAK